MSPETHLLASWLIAAKTTRNPRDCRLVALAGILPDADGLGLLIDLTSKALGHPTSLYQQYHHWLLHGAFGAFLIALLLAGFARERGRVFLLALGLVHLHLICDLLGSRGPTTDDFWPIYYFGPFTRQCVWIWKGQWRLDGWQNRYLSVVLFGWALWLASKRGDSIVGVFNRRADTLFVRVLRKWRAGILSSKALLQVKRPPWRTIVPAFGLIGFLVGNYLVWQPGLDVRDGAHDLRHNGIWIAHEWLGSDGWFVQNGKTNQFATYRDLERIRKLSELLRQNHIRDIFPHLCPTEVSGDLPGVDDAQTERFLTVFAGFRVMPWIGGSKGHNVRYDDAQWRRNFFISVSNLFASHPRLSGVHLNVEPVPNGDTGYLSFLDELRAALPKGKLLSIAAYPPPTWWHSYAELHWDEKYFRQVARRSDQLVVMMYNTSLRVPKVYQSLMADWTGEVLAWSEGKPTLLGIPTYDDGDVGDHDSKVENLQNALLGIHQSLSENPFSRSYQGVALYSESETDAAEWQYFREHFLKP